MMDRLRNTRASALAAALTLGAAGGGLTQEPGAGSRDVSGAFASPHGGLSIDLDCSACHTPRGWSPARRDPDFDHGGDARTPLTGRHETATCAGCHLELRFDEPRVTLEHCASCHVDVHRGAQSEDCADCHDTESFTTRTDADVHARTSFPLTGAHLLVHCESCHADDRSARFDALDTDCVSCHRPDYESSTAVDHVGLGYPTDCLSCHNTVAWFNRASFDHLAASAGFDLVGTHVVLGCTSCHRPPDNSPIFTPAGQNDCVACHRSEYEGAHPLADVTVTCADCHAQTRWDVIIGGTSRGGGP